MMTKRVNGKNKGNSYERKIANLFSDRFSEFLGVKTGFRRNSDSGSYFGGTNQARTQTHSLDYAVFGDLICPKNFRYVVECKHYKTAPSWNSFINGEIRQWDEWINQNTQDSNNAGRPGALVVKYNNISDLVFLETQVESLRLCFKYQTRCVYLLNDWLKLPDSEFFTSDA